MRRTTRCSLAATLVCCVPLAACSPSVDPRPDVAPTDARAADDADVVAEVDAGDGYAGRRRFPDGDLPARRDASTDAGELALPDAPPMGSDSGGSGSVDSTTMVSIVVHLEGTSLAEPATMARYEAFLRSYADAFEARGARMTIETSVFSDALYAMAPTDTTHVLTELEARGHDIAVHADVGGVLPAGYDQEDFVADLAAMRMRQEAIGLHPTHVSGICSSLDWVDAAIRAGFPFATSTVEYCLKSLPLDLQPPEVRDCTSPATCHGIYPTTLPERITVRRVRSGEDWTTSAPDGGLVLVP